MNNLIAERVSALRHEMVAESIDVIIFPSTDPHNSEYPATHWHSREWISGFTGSAGTAVVTLHEAALWTDSRYFLQASNQLEGTPFVLMKDGIEGTPTIMQWISRKLSAYGGTCVAVDGQVRSYDEVVTMKEELRKLGGITVRTNYDAMRMIWKERPLPPKGEIRLHPIEYAGEAITDKIKRVRAAMSEQKCQAHITTDLMNIAWLMNLRGCDVKYTPVFISFLYMDMESVSLFINKECLTPEATTMLTESGVTTYPYEAFTSFVERKYKEDFKKHQDRKILCDSKTTNYSINNIIASNAVSAPSPIGMMKAIKNQSEIEGFRRSMLRDGVALVRFLNWLLPAVEQGGQTELSISQKLESLRAESPMFRELSFSTIAGYNAHGAIVHYSATPESDATLRPEGLLLIDSGAQYTDGTTDITRTIALGPLTDEMKKAYTVILKAHISLATAHFPVGTCGTQIDALARGVLWKYGMNYLHGTGHGVGSQLAVHEGPQSMRTTWEPAPMYAGMTLTDEPGLYAEGRFGVRTENTMLITECEETEYGRFLCLEPLTLCPIDLTPVVWEMMSKEEIQWLNDYHARVYRELMPLLTDASDKNWLTSATKPYQI